MNPFSFLHLLQPPSKNKETEIPNILLEEFDQNITDGGEFIDDSLRMIDQPLVYTEISVAAGNPAEMF